jgi:catechol-2,3-dioxygenase
MFSHIELNVSDLDQSTHFYLTALAPLGFQVADRADEYVRLSNGKNVVIVLCPVGEAYRDHRYHRKGVGLGHFAIAVEARRSIDEMAAHLASVDIPLLGEGKIELGYRRGYYTLAFEDPDRIMIEIVHTDPYYYSLLPP